MLNDATSFVKSSVWAVLLLPWTICRDWAWQANEVLSDFLVYAGRPPSHFAAKTQVVEYKQLMEKLQRSELLYKQEMQALKMEISQLAVTKENLGSKFKQMKDQNEQLLSQVRTRERTTGNLSWVTHLSLGFACLAIRWLYQSSNVHADHKLVSALICWPVVVIYVMWMLRCVPSSSLTPGILTCMSWAILGYVVHAAVQLQMVRPNCEPRIEMAAAR